MSEPRAAALMLLYLGVHLVAPAGMGAGDVKLAIGLGALTGAFGADVWIEPEGNDKSPSRLLLLVQGKTGYLHLCELLSRGWVLNAQRAQAWIKWEWLAELNDGLLALSGAEHGAVVGQPPRPCDDRRSRGADRGRGGPPAALP